MSMVNVRARRDRLVAFDQRAHRRNVAQADFAWSRRRSTAMARRIRRWRGSRMHWIAVGLDRGAVGQLARRLRLRHGLPKM